MDGQLQAPDEENNAVVTPEQGVPEPELENQSRLEYLNAVNPRPKRPGWIKWLVIIIVLLLVGGGGFAGWKYLQKPKASDTPATTTTTKKKTPAQEDIKVVTEHHDSSYFNLGFEYPQKWTVTDSGDGKLSVASPASQLTTASGQKQYVQTVVTIAAKGQNLTAFDKGSALSVRDSEKIKYTNPTQVQRAETYLTFAQYASTTAASALDALYVTGDFGYLKGQYIPKADMVKLDPVISVTFNTCGDAKCTKTPTPVSLDTSVWQQQAFSKPILTLLTSLSVN